MKKSFLILLVLSCFYLDSVNQPSSVAIGERIVITINGNYNTDGYGGGTAWLAIMLPTGFVVDSIVYRSSDTIRGVVTEVDSELIWYLDYEYPCDSHMCWQAFTQDCWPAESIGTYTAIIHSLVTDSTRQGTYLLDYRSGNYGSRIYNDDSILDQPILVTQTAINEMVVNRAGKSNAVWPTIFNNTLNIFTDKANRVEIFSEDGRLVKSFNLESCILDRGSTISWNGTDQANRQLGSGVYFVKFVSGNYEETEKVLLIR